MQNSLSLKRLLCYTAGMLILAIGLTLTAQSGVGTSPLTSIAFVLGKCLNIRFSDATLIMFSLFVIVQIILEKKKTPLTVGKLLLQIPLSILFTRIDSIMNGTANANWESYLSQLKNAGLDQMLDVYRQAYARYLSNQ